MKAAPSATSAATKSSGGAHAFERVMAEGLGACGAPETRSAKSPRDAVRVDRTALHCADDLSGLA